LSKALKLQQDDEDRKNGFFINNLERNIEDLENSLKEKDALLSSVEGSLAEARLRNEKQGILISNLDIGIEKLSKELEETTTILEENRSRFSRESETLNMKIKAEAGKSFKLSGTLKALQDRCFGFATQCSA
jgi:chromosome segregation ATPase